MDIQSPNLESVTGLKASQQLSQPEHLHSFVLLVKDQHSGRVNLFG